MNHAVSQGLLTRRTLVIHPIRVQPCFTSHPETLIKMTYYERYRDIFLLRLLRLMMIRLYGHREERKVYQRMYSVTHSRAARRKVGKKQKEASSTLWKAIKSARYVCLP